MNPQEIRKEIHQLVDRLSEEELLVARRVLEGLQAVGDPVIRALVQAPEEEAPISEEERAALREAEEDLRRGRVRELDDYLAERDE